MARNVQVRGCCCGIPFSFGVILITAGSFAFWQLAVSGWPGWPF